VSVLPGEKDLKEVTQSRQVKRKKRQDQKIPTVALVGYTNAGKSTLLNALTEANTLVHDGLFTTLDSLSRQAVLPNHLKVVFFRYCRVHACLAARVDRGFQGDPRRSWRGRPIITCAGYQS